MIGNRENITIPKIELCIHRLLIFISGFLLLGISDKMSDPINREKHKYKSVSDK